MSDEVIVVPTEEKVVSPVELQTAPIEEKKEATTSISEEEAAKVLQEIQQKKVNACIEEIKIALEKHQCRMVVSPAEINIIPDIRK